RPRLRRQDSGGGRPPRHAGPDKPHPHQRGRRRRHYLTAPRTPGTPRSPAPRNPPLPPPHPLPPPENTPRHLTGSAVQRPRPKAQPRAPADHGRLGEVDRHPHLPPHALRDRLGRERPAEVRSHGEP